MHRSFIFLAEGFEEIEALTVVDVMRRAGMDIKTVSITDSKKVTGAHGISVEADMTFKEADYSGSEWLILPGGMPGATHLHEFEALGDLLKVHKGKIAAICASPAPRRPRSHMLPRLRSRMQEIWRRDARCSRDDPRYSHHRQRPELIAAFRACHRCQFSGRQRGPAGRVGNALLSQNNEFLFLTHSL